MEKNIASGTPNKTLWLQVWALAAVQGAISLAWLIYNLYMPQLLTQFGLSASLATGLVILENALAVIMEPLFGGLSDNAKRWLGSRFGFISAGVILASALFIAIPALVTFTQPDVVTRSLLPIVAVAWALAMTVFRSPAIALLGRYATPEALPLAGSLLTLVGGTINAFRGTANKFILSLGPVFTFAIGSFTLLAAAAALRYVNPPEKPVDKHHAEVLQLPLQKLGLIFFTGAGIAWGSRFLMDALGKVLKTQFNTDNIDLLMLWIGLTLAFSALPAGAFAVKIGNRKAMLLGIGVTLVAMGMLIYMDAQIPTIFFTIAGFSVIVNGAVPFVLGLMPQRWGGLGVGTYFSGFGGGMSLFGVLFGQVQGITPVMGVIGGAIAFLVAGGCIGASRRSN